MAVSRNVTVIPAIKRVGNNKTSESKPKIRVAAYCRDKEIVIKKDMSQSQTLKTAIHETAHARLHDKLY